MKPTVVQPQGQQSLLCWPKHTKESKCMYIFIHFGGRIQQVSVVGFDEICQRPWNQQSHTVSFDSQSDLESAATRTARRSYAELDMHARAL